MIVSTIRLVEYESLMSERTLVYNTWQDKPLRTKSRNMGIILKETDIQEVKL